MCTEKCGDGFNMGGVNACDDGNTAPGDGYAFTINSYISVVQQYVLKNQDGNAQAEVQHRRTFVKKHVEMA